MPDTNSTLHGRRKKAQSNSDSLQDNLNLSFSPIGWRTPTIPSISLEIKWRSGYFRDEPCPKARTPSAKKATPDGK